MEIEIGSYAEKFPEYGLCGDRPSGRHLWRVGHECSELNDYDDGWIKHRVSCVVCGCVTILFWHTLREPGLVKAARRKFIRSLYAIP